MGSEIWGSWGGLVDHLQPHPPSRDNQEVGDSYPCCYRRHNGMQSPLWQACRNLADIANPQSSTPRSRKRSSTNLADLRLAPLSARFAEEVVEPAGPRSAPRSPYEEAKELAYNRNHPSYLQGRSAPSTPGILSRSSSRRHLGGGLSRRGSLYDDGVESNYVSARESPEVSLYGRTNGSGMPKAKSEATLALKTRLTGHHPARHSAKGGVRSPDLPRRSKTHGMNTPRSRSRLNDESWLSHATSTAHTLLQESKGHTWRSSSSLLETNISDEDEDEGYEELAALSTLQLPQTGPESPVSERAQHRWGSRFGSRNASRRTSRRGSMTNLRTPLATADSAGGYFDALEPAEEASSADDDHEAPSADEAELALLAQGRGAGIGGFVDRIVNFSLFDVAESEESGVEASREGEARASAPPLPPPPAPNEEGEKVGLWEDAAWLLSIAGRALT